MNEPIPNYTEFRKWFNNNDNFQEFIDSLEYFHEKCESHLEARLYDQCRTLDLDPEIQLWIGKYRVDQAYKLPNGKYLIVEADGSQHYDPQQLQEDSKRDEELMNNGHNVIRFETDYLLNLRDAYYCACVVKRALEFLIEEDRLLIWRNSVIEGIEKLKDYYDADSVSSIDEMISEINESFENAVFDEFYQPTDSDDRMITQVHLERRNAVWKLKYDTELMKGHYCSVEYRLYAPSEEVY